MTKKGQRDGNKLEENNADKVTKRKKELNMEKKGQ